jgi:nucleoside-diphosphate-sugar epimerase
MSQTLNITRVLVTGAGGYVGSRLVPALLSRGYEVVAVDTYWYGEDVFGNLASNNRLTIVKMDIRDTDKLQQSLIGVQIVIHLACISNDPSFDLNPQLGKSVNLESFLPLVKLAKQVGVERFVYASSSSVYGIKEEERVTENLPLEPLTDYSNFKKQCEEMLLEHTSGNFVGTILRPATVCGFSPRQRFDLSVNILTNHALNEGRIRIYGGSQFRPNIHIEDIVRAYLLVIESPLTLVDNEIFNVGDQNLSLNEIASIVSRLTSVGVMEYLPTDDLRSYRVDSTRIKSKLGFAFEYTVENAVQDLIDKFNAGAFRNSLHNSKYFNIKRMQELNL